jgi:hypothetical protein
VSAAQRRRRRSPWRRPITWALVLLLVFALGIALGQALEEGPPPGSTTTVDQTFILPPESNTVTVTTP